MGLTASCSAISAIQREKGWYVACRIFPDFHVWQPGPGSAGPDLYLSAGSVLVCMSAKARMGKQPFKLEEVAKNISYIMQFGEPMFVLDPWILFT